MLRNESLCLLLIAVLYISLTLNQTRLLPQEVLHHQGLNSFVSNSATWQQSQKPAIDTTRIRKQGEEIANHRESRKKNDKIPTPPGPPIIPPNFEMQTDYRNCSFNQPYPRPRHTCHTQPGTQIPYCHIENLQINYQDIDKISLKARGGENVSQVLGQAESDEFPTYRPGAFVTSRPLRMSKTIDKSQMFYIDNVLSSLQVVDQHKPECDVRLSGNTLLLTRYEYCNLYHTMTDWFNAFLAMPSKTNIILLDAHAHGKLDPVWTTLWGNVTYIRQWEGKRVCLEEATLVPPGYASVLWRRGRSRLAKGVCPSMVDAFVKFFVQGHGLGDIQMEQGKVVIVDRIPYLAHPRSKPSSAERVVKNFDQVAAVLNNMTEVTSVQIVHFENRTFREQLAVIRSAHILMGNHGAGLAHLIFMQDDSALMEFEQPASGMMADFSRWKTKIQHIFLPQVERGKVSYQTIHESIVPQVRAVLLGKSWS